MSYIYIYIYIYMERLFLMFLDHTQRRSTVGRTPLEFEPKISAGERPAAARLLRSPKVSSKVYHDSFCQLGNSVSLPWVLYYGAFYLHIVSSFSCIPVIYLKLVLFLIPLQFVHLFCNQSKCILLPVQRLKVAILPLDLPCSGPVIHSGEILTTGKSQSDTRFS